MGAAAMVAKDRGFLSFAFWAHRTLRIDGDQSPALDSLTIRRSLSNIYRSRRRARGGVVIAVAVVEARDRSPTLEQVRVSTGRGYPRTLPPPDPPPGERYTASPDLGAMMHIDE